MNLVYGCVHCVWLCNFLWLLFQPMWGSNAIDCICLSECVHLLLLCVDLLLYYHLQQNKLHIHFSVQR